MASMWLALALTGVWQLANAGVWLTEMPVPQDGALIPVRAIVVRLDPSKLRFALDRVSRNYGLLPAWTIDRLPPDALLAANAGQFAGGAPWGWLVRDGVEVQPPGEGSLGMAFVVSKSGGVSLVTQDELPSARREAAQAFQSYPALLTEDGRVPRELQAPGHGVDLTHRDSRLALGVTSDGSILLVLTRVDVIGRGTETIPWGPTVPEMAAFMKSLGCERAVMLDGGLSSQLAVRGRDGVSSWKNWREVPLGLIVFPAADTKVDPNRP